jgi:hypothetical protein
MRTGTSARYCGRARPATRTGRVTALAVFFEFLELRHKVELHNLTGRVVECPLDEINRPRASVDPQLRVPPTEAEIDALFSGRAELATCRKVRPGRTQLRRRPAGLRRGTTDQRGPDARPGRRSLGAGTVGKLTVRHGKGSRRRGPKPWLVPLINGADRTLRWFIEDVWGQFDLDHTRPGAPLFPSERKNADVSAAARATAEVFRRSLAEAAAAHLPSWAGKLTPHVLRHYRCRPRFPRPRGRPRNRLRRPT